jgi:peptidoglycan/xylan/chitin deacetylase (PgdA/CDA1 family)
MIWIIITLAVILSAITVSQFIFRPPFWVVRSLSKQNPGALFYVNTDERAIALTIDDAPHPDVTPGILEVLRKHGATATFFVIGSYAEKYPKLVEAIRSDGHELGNHMYLDRMSAGLSSEEFAEKLKRTDELIRPEGPVKWFRPGSGMINDRIVRLVEDNGYRVCLASVYPLDVRVPAAIASRQFLHNARPGAILVLHDGLRKRRTTIRVLERVLPELKQRGYRVLSVSELVDLANQAR